MGMLRWRMVRRGGRKRKVRIRLAATPSMGQGIFGAFADGGSWVGGGGMGYAMGYAMGKGYGWLRT